MREIQAVTGATGYTGKYIARRLHDQGKPVLNLTNHPERRKPDGIVFPHAPLNFDRPDQLEAHLAEVDVLYNTYWVRFDHGETTYGKAVQDTRLLIRAARNAGVRRLVHVSITNPSVDSRLPYFQGKAVLEEEIRQSGLSYAILRPTVLFGLEDILINNIAYLLRRFPVFGIPGDGEYRLQPVYVDDFAEFAVQAGADGQDISRDVVGPDIFTYNQLVELIAESIGRKPALFHLPPAAALFLANMLGLYYRDVLITREEYLGLSENLLVSSEPPVAATRLGDWLSENAQQVGIRYASEIERHYLRSRG